MMISKVFVATSSVLALGISLSTLSFFWLRSIRLDELVSTFESDSQFVSERMWRNILIDVNTADTANFIITVPEIVDKDTYSTFTQLAAGFGPGSKASVRWNPFVPSSERATFEESVRMEIPDFIITQESSDGTLEERVVDDDDLWPSLYIHPENDEFVGFDINTNPEYKDAIEFMLRVKDNTVSDRVFDEVTGNPSIQSLQPVFNSSGDIVGCVTRLIDVVGSVMLLQAILARDNIVPFDTYDGLKIRVYLVLGNGVERLMFDSTGMEEFGVSETPSGEFEREGDDTSFSRYGSLDDLVGLKVVLKANIKVERDEAVLPLVLGLLSTFLIAFGIKKWRTLLSHRKKALDIAIHESEHKTKFVSEMSHEFRTPLNGILGMTQLLKNEEQTKHGSNYITIIDSCSTMLMGIVNDILDFSKLSSGGMSIHPCPNDIRALFTETMLAMCATYKKRENTGDVFLVLNIDKSVPSGFCTFDEVRVRQIVVNYVSNALKFTDNGNITVSVSCTSHNPSDGEIQLVVDVSDTGLGIPQSKIGELFKSFSQVHDPRVTKAGGTGLGLVICKTLAEKMGGGVSCESTLGRGSTFSFNCKIEGSLCGKEDVRHIEWNLGDDKSKNILDVVNIDRPSKPVIEDTGSCFEEKSSERTRPSILIVDDTKINRLLLMRMLEPLNISISSASDGSEAVKECENKKFSLIFMDVMMPIMGGTEAHRIITKSGCVNANTPVICTSNSEFVGTMDDSILKPMSTNKVYEKLTKWLSDSEVTWMYDHWKSHKEKSNE